MRVSPLCIVLLCIAPATRANDAVDVGAGAATPAEPAIMGPLSEHGDEAESRGEVESRDEASARAANAPTAKAPDPERAPAQRKILVLTPTADDSLASTAEVVANLVAVKAASYATLDVMTTSDVVRLMSLEADRQMLGCDDTSCAAEIADAMGANLVIFGDVSKLGSVLVVNLSLFNSDTATPIGRVVVQSSDARTLPGALDPRIEGLLANLPDVGASTLTLTNVPAEESGPSILPWTVAGGGAVVFVSGVVLGVVVASIPYFLAWNATNEAASALASADGSPEDQTQARGAYEAAQENYAFAQSIERPFLGASAALFTVAAAGLAAGVGGAFFALSSGDDE
jgi:hypothetical protein